MYSILGADKLRRILYLQFTNALQFLQISAIRTKKQNNSRVEKCFMIARSSSLFKKTFKMKVINRHCIEDKIEANYLFIKDLNNVFSCKKSKNGTQ